MTKAHLSILSALVVALVGALPTGALAATVDLPPDAIIGTPTNLAGVLSDLDEDPNTPDGLWLTNTGAVNATTAVRVSFPTPANNPQTGAGLQVCAFWVRKTTAGTGTCNPDATIQLFETGVAVGTPLAASVALSVSSLTGELITFAWDAALLGTPNGSAVECRVTSNGCGNTTNGHTVEVGAVEWRALLPDATPTPTATGTPEPTSTETPEPTTTATETPEPTATETPEPTTTATETPEPTATETPEPTATATESPTPTATETPEPTATATESPTPTATETPEETATPTESPTATESPTPTATETPEESPTPTATSTEATPTATETATPEDTATPTPTSTEATPTPTETATPTATETATPTTTESPTPTLSPTPTVTVTPTPGPGLDHFLCYEIHRPAINVEGVSTADEFFPISTVKVRQAKRLCAPVNKNGEDPTAPTHPGHETAYTIRQTSPKFTRVNDIPVAIDNDFGSQPPTFPNFTVDLVRAERLLVPTSKSLVGPNFPPPLAVDLDHFKCYRVRGARFRRASVTVETQFGPLNVDIKRPRDLCVPVDKNGEGIFDDTQSLMCFQVRTTPQTAKQVFTTNQFEQGAYDIFGVRDLCVPAFVSPGTCGDGSINAPGEECDDGNLLNGDGCDAQCKIEPQPVCNDGTVTPPFEECDPPGASATCPSQICAGDCLCALPECGDGVVNGFEECDGSISTCPPNPMETCHPISCTCECTPSPICAPFSCAQVPDGCGGMFQCTCPGGSICNQQTTQCEFPCEPEGDNCNFDSDCCSDFCDGGICGPD